MTEPLTVLLVDDDASILTSLYHVLEAEGYSVLAAGKGVDALDIIDGQGPEAGLFSAEDGYKSPSAAPQRVTRGGNSL